MDLELVTVNKIQGLFKKAAQKGVAVKSQYVSKRRNLGSP